MEEDTSYRIETKITDSQTGKEQRLPVILVRKLPRAMQRMGKLMDVIASMEGIYEAEMTLYSWDGVFCLSLKMNAKDWRTQ